MKSKLTVYLIILTWLLFGIACQKSDNKKLSEEKTDEIANNKEINKAENSDKEETKINLLNTQKSYNQINITSETGKEAIESAINTNQYLFLLFFEKENELFKAMNETLENFRNRSSENIIIYKALTTNEKEAGIVGKYGINRAPLPVVLVFAPNGAITGGFPKSVTNQQLEKSIVSELTMKILKPLQERKIVLVSLQNNKTKFNQESAKAINDFSNEPRLKGFVGIIKEDPDDIKIKDFLTQCKLDKKISEATIVFIVPPGSIAGVFTGKITKETLMAALASCGSGSGTCCPR